MLKTLFIGSALIAAWAIAGCSSAVDATPTGPRVERFLIISGGTPRPLRRDFAARLMDHVGSQAVASELIHVVDGSSLTPVATLQVPAGTRSARLRDKTLQREMAKVAAFLNSDSEDEMGLRLPGVAATVRALRRTEWPCRVTLIGPPTFQDPRHPGWSMTEDLVPTDGSIGAHRSPFTTEVKFSAGTEITWIVPVADWGVDQLHRDAVTRFHRLYLQEQEGRLIRLSPDVATAFQFENPQFEDRVVRQDVAVEMKRTSAMSRRDQTAEPPSIVEVPINSTTEPASPPIVPDQAVNSSLAQAEANVGQIAIAIGWRSDDPATDLDIFLSDARHPGEEIYHERTETSFGKLLRDVRKSGVTETADFQDTWECVVVNHDRLQDLTLWVNAYRLEKAATLRVIRVWNGSRREFIVPFPGSAGDGGKDHNRRHESPSWLKVRL